VGGDVGFVFYASCHHSFLGFFCVFVVVVGVVCPIFLPLLEFLYCLLFKQFKFLFEVSNGVL